MGGVVLFDGLPTTTKMGFDQCEHVSRTKVISVLKKSLGALNAPGGRYLTVDNLHQVLQPFGLNEDGDVVDLIRAAHLTDDGRIDFNEFDKVLQNQLASLDEPIEDCVRNAFELLDYDKNGYITIPELFHLFGEVGEMWTDSDLYEVVKAGDIDGDGRLDLEDFFKFLGYNNSTQTTEVPAIAEETSYWPPAIEKIQLVQEEIVSGRVNSGRRSGLSRPGSHAIVMVLREAEDAGLLQYRTEEPQTQPIPSDEQPKLLSPMPKISQRRRSNSLIPPSCSPSVKPKGRPRSSSVARQRQSSLECNSLVSLLQVQKLESVLKQNLSIPGSLTAVGSRRESLCSRRSSVEDDHLMARQNTSRHGSLTEDGSRRGSLCNRRSSVEDDHLMTGQNASRRGSSKSDGSRRGSMCNRKSSAGDDDLLIRRNSNRPGSLTAEDNRRGSLCSQPSCGGDDVLLIRQSTIHSRRSSECSNKSTSNDNQPRKDQTKDTTQSKKSELEIKDQVNAEKTQCSKHVADGFPDKCRQSLIQLLATKTNEDQIRVEDEESKYAEVSETETIDKTDNLLDTECIATYNSFVTVTETLLADCESSNSGPRDVHEGTDSSDSSGQYDTTVSETLKHDTKLEPKDAIANSILKFHHVDIPSEPFVLEQDKHIFDSSEHAINTDIYPGLHHEIWVTADTEKASENSLSKSDEFDAPSCDPSAWDDTSSMSDMSIKDAESLVDKKDSECLLHHSVASESHNLPTVHAPELNITSHLQNKEKFDIHEFAKQMDATLLHGTSSKLDLKCYQKETSVDELERCRLWHETPSQKNLQPALSKPVIEDSSPDSGFVEQNFNSLIQTIDHKLKQKMGRINTNRQPILHSSPAFIFQHLRHGKVNHTQPRQLGLLPFRKMPPSTKIIDKHLYRQDTQGRCMGHGLVLGGQTVSRTGHPLASKTYTDTRSEQECKANRLNLDRQKRENRSPVRVAKQQLTLTLRHQRSRDNLMRHQSLSRSIAQETRQKGLNVTQYTLTKKRQLLKKPSQRPMRTIQQTIIQLSLPENISNNVKPKKRSRLSSLPTNVGRLCCR